MHTKSPISFPFSTPRLYPAHHHLCDVSALLHNRAMSQAHLAAVDNLSATVAQLLHTPPGAHALTIASKIDPFALSAADRVDFLAALERQDGWLYALKQRAITAVAGFAPSIGGGPISGVDGCEREDISTALRLAPATAQSRIDVARTLINSLPGTCSALATGEISAAHATVIARETAQMIRDGAAESTISQLEEGAISYSEFHTPGQVASHLRSKIAQLAPEEFEERVVRAQSLRRVSCINESDGMSTIIAILPAADAQIVMHSIESFILRQNQQYQEQGNQSQKIQNQEGGDQNFSQGFDRLSEYRALTADQKRADALTAICSTVLSDLSTTVAAHRRALTINVTIDLPTLLGLAENPGQLAGYGAIPASVARHLASDSRWRRFITEPQSGNLLDLGRESYDPSQQLKDFLIARDRTCRFPGCRRSALLSDLDHAQSWERGGATSPENIGALCRRHHRLKTHDGWEISSYPDGSCTWRSPLGKEFFTPARSINEPI